MNMTIDTTGSVIKDLGDKVMANLLYRQGKTDEVVNLLQHTLIANSSPQQQLLLAKAYAEQGHWEKMVEVAIDLSKKPDSTDDLKRHIANLFLKAGIFFSEHNRWKETFQCLKEAREIDPTNPVLQHLPSEIEADFPIILHASGDYLGATQNLIEAGCCNLSDEKLHLLAISSLSLLIQEKDMELTEQIILLEQAHSYWNALAGRKAYWQTRAESRQKIYREKTDQEELLQLMPSAGISRCEALLDNIEDSIQNENRATVHHNFDQARTNMVIEKQSSLLLEKIRENNTVPWPTGGFKFLESYWGKAEYNKHLKSIFSQEQGSDGWIIQGLASTDEQTRRVFLLYASGAFSECADKAAEGNNSLLTEVSVIAAIRHAEESISAQRFSDCRLLAKRLKGVRNRILRQKGELVLDQMATQYIDTLRSQGRTDEILDLVKDFLESFTLPQLSGKAAGVFLKHAEKCYFEGQFEDSLRFFHKAYSSSSDKSLCEKQLIKMIKHSLNTNFEAKNFRAVFSFVDKVTPQYGHLASVRAQVAFIKAMEAIETHGVKSTLVMNNLETAYNADTSDKEISSFYALALSMKAVDTLNTINQQAGQYAIRQVIQDAENLLLKALRVDPGNKQALENLRQLFNLIKDAPGLSLSPESLRAILQF